MSVNVLFAVFFSIVENTTISDLLCFRTGATWFQRLSISANGQFAGMC
jgi:hypothetical protein